MCRRGSVQSQLGIILGFISCQHHLVMLITVITPHTQVAHGVALRWTGSPVSSK
jgi:hypothetical protein